MATIARRDVIRLTNERIRSCADPRLEDYALWQFFCECGCFRLVPMTLHDYDAGGGVWAEGHRPLEPE
jgi:hypothetical protein